MRLHLIFLIGLLFTAPAVADISNETIRAYNEALSAGEEPGIIETAEALANEAAASPDIEGADAMAFEAAWMLCLVNECKNANDAASFAAANVSGVETDYPSTELRNVLASFAAWKEDDSNSNRRTMVARLAELDADDVSIVSMTIHREHFIYCANKRAWKDATKAATAAANHTAAFKNEVFEEYAFAQLNAIIAAFQNRPDVDQYHDMLQLRQEIEENRALLQESSPDTENTGLTKIGYRTDAWTGALQAYFISTGDQRKVDRIEETLDLDGFPVQEDTSDLCEGDFNGQPQIEYPREALRDLAIGSIIVGFDLSNGKTENVEVLAAVPEGIFDEAAKKAVEELTWSPAEGIDLSSCSMERSNIIYPFTSFSIDAR